MTSSRRGAPFAREREPDGLDAWRAACSTAMRDEGSGAARHALFTPDGGEADPVFRIGLRPLPLADWFEGGDADPARKDALFAAHPELVWGEIEGSRPAQREAAELMRGAGLTSREGDDPPLRAAARAVADDLCLMEPRPGGWTLTAASLCSPSFFSAAEAVGRPLHALHAPVPGFNDRLLARVARIFDHLAAETILERRNWSVVSRAELFLPSADPVRAEAAMLAPAALAERLTVRRERQTIRRLPLCGGVLFTIRIWREPLPALLADPLRREAFAAAWARVMDRDGADFRGYKGLAALDPAVQVLMRG